MGNQKQAVLTLVEEHRGQGRTVGEVLGSVGVARSSYYRWKKSEGAKKGKRQSSYGLTAEERDLIDEVKATHPQYRHRRIQGMLQQEGIYLSASAIYGHLKELGQIEPYERREAPWKSPRYEGMAEKPDVGQRLDQALGGRSAVVFADGDRFLFSMDCCL